MKLMTAVLVNGSKEFIWAVRAYNYEAIWLSTTDFDEVYMISYRLHA
jgi:uncharacterized membrane protein